MLSEKIRGEALYCDDIQIENCLYGKTLRSGIAHGKIKEIRYPSMPEGYFVVDYRDIKGNNIVKIIDLDQPVLAENFVSYIGEPISIIVGRDKKTLEKLVKDTDIKYEELEPLLHMDENSVFQDISTERGDMERAKREARYIFTKIMETGPQEHIYMETQGMIATFDGKELTVTGSLQSLYAVKNAVEYCTGFPARVKAAEIGGGFGGKEDFPSLLACHASLCAIKAGGTVKIIYEREEDIICTTKRHPSKSCYTLYLDENYRILGVEADLRLEAGAYIGLSNLILEVFMGRACGVYRVPNVKIRARTFKTNKISFGAWRGFGAPQGIFAIETALDLFARERNLDPVQVKKINLAQKGDLSTTGGLYREEVKLPQMLEELLVKSDYYNKLEKFKKDSGKYLKGIGVSFSLLGGGLNGTTERDIQKSKIRLCRNSNGDYGIFSTVLEIGQGPSITLPHIVAQVLEISAEKVKLHTPDSKFCPDSGPTVASRSALIVGKLVERAAQKMKKLLELEGNLGKSLEVEEEYHHPEGFQWDNDKHRGDFNINSS
ncbi:MAG: xanthine dehydrogenase family protein molybdopterin-binding subunit, partial [Fusobacteriaceae bacterium]